jgi:hypothetical protein
MTNPQLKKLTANAAEIKAWVEALQCVGDWDAPAAVAIRHHIAALTDNQARLLGLSEDEIARINEESEAAVEAQIEAEVWRALETAPPELVAEIKKLVGREGK